jgi:hypothetical protein
MVGWSTSVYTQATKLGGMGVVGGGIAVQPQLASLLGPLLRDDDGQEEGTFYFSSYFPPANK